MAIKLLIAGNTIEINGRRYDRHMFSKSNMARIEKIVNALPEDRKTCEVESDLSLTLYVFGEDKSKPTSNCPGCDGSGWYEWTIAGTATKITSQCQHCNPRERRQWNDVRDCAVTPAAAELTTYIDETECPSCREIVSDDEMKEGICEYCRDEMEEEERESMCGFCDGSGQIARWTFGRDGAYEVFRACPECSR